MESSSTKELFKDVVHVRGRSSTALFLLFDPFFSKLIICFSLLLIRESLISICNFLELSLCCIRVFLIFVRMKLDSQLLKCFLNLILSCVSFDAEKLVVIFALILFGLLSLLVMMITVASVTISSISSHIEPKLCLD